MKKVIISIAFLLATVAVNAQTEQNPAFYKHEYSVYLTGGMSNLVYKLDGTSHSGGKTEGGFGAGAGFAYAHNLTNRFGISTGLEFATFKGAARYETVGEEYDAVDDIGETLRYSYSISGYRESQNLAMISIPVMAQYKMPISGKIHFYASGGFKLGFPVNAESIIQAGELNSSGSYDFEQVPYVDLPEYGFFTDYRPDEQKGELELGVAAILSLESGLRFNFGKTALYAGVYFDYSLNDLKESKDKHLLNYNRLITYESVLNTPLVDKLNLMSVGVKIRFSINPVNKVVAKK